MMLIKHTCSANPLDIAANGLRAVSGCVARADLNGNNEYNIASWEITDKNLVGDKTTITI